MIHVVPDSEGIAEAGVRLVTTMLKGRARQTEGDVSLALSGGSTPRRMYELLASERGDLIPWRRVSLFWGDERCVPSDNVRSNYGMVARTGLLERPFASVHPMPGDLPPEEGADEYERVLSQALGDGKMQRIDLVLLGLGNDGHTASLFPGHSSLAYADHPVVATGLYEGTRRLTLTMPVLAAARSLLFLVGGEAKAKAVHRVLSDERPPVEDVPPARTLLDMIAVKEKAGWECPTVTWVLDRAAAALLPRRGSS